MNNYIRNSADLEYNYKVGDETVVSNASSNEIVTEVEAPNVTVLNESYTDKAKAGENIQYSISITNSGNAPTPENVVMKDLIPSQVEVVSDSVKVLLLNPDKSYTTLELVNTVEEVAEGKYYSDQNNPINLTMPALEGSAAYNIKYTVKVNGDVLNPNGDNGGVEYTFSDIENTASVSYNADTTTTPIESNLNTVSGSYAHVDVIKTAAAVIQCGEDPEYTLEVTNYGNLDTENVVITDYLPEGFTFATENIIDHIDVFNGEVSIKDEILDTATFDAIDPLPGTAGLLKISFKPDAAIPGVVKDDPDSQYRITTYTVRITGVINCQ